MHQFAVIGEGLHFFWENPNIAGELVDITAENFSPFASKAVESARESYLSAQKRYEQINQQ